MNTRALFTSGCEARLSRVKTLSTTDFSVSLSDKSAINILMSNSSYPLFLSLWEALYLCIIVLSAFHPVDNLSKFKSGFLNDISSFSVLTLITISSSIGAPAYIPLSVDTLNFLPLYIRDIPSLILS